MNLDHLTMAVITEEVARCWASLGLTMYFVSSTPRTVLESAPEKMRRRLLPRALEGDLIFCGALSEPNAGSDLSSLETTAVLDGDEYVINGTKSWISNGSIADVVSVLCVTDKSKGRQGISQILVEKEVSPFTIREQHKLGWHCYPTAELSFQDCRVPKENLIGDSSKGYRNTMRGMETARSGMALTGVGISQAAIDISINYPRERVQFGRPIGSFQLIQNMIADMIAETEASRFLTYRSFWLLDKGVRARLESSLAKFYSCEAAFRVASQAVQIHGAVGLSDDYPVERLFRDARMLTIPDGTTEINKLIVGRESIGLRAFA